MTGCCSGALAFNSALAAAPLAEAGRVIVALAAGKGWPKEMPDQATGLADSSSFKCDGTATAAVSMME
jgi:hypothetical protein